MNLVKASIFILALTSFTVGLFVCLLFVYNDLEADHPTLNDKSTTKISWATEYSPSELYTLWNGHTPKLPDRRLSTIEDSEWLNVICSDWLIPYLKTVSTQSDEAEKAVILPTTGSHGIGDWEMMFIYKTRKAVENIQKVYIDWPDIIHSSLNRNGAISPIDIYNLTNSWKQDTQLRGASVSEARDSLSINTNIHIKFPINHMSEACLFKYFLPPSERLLSYNERVRNVILDPHALTIGIHIRSGAADGHIDSRHEVDEETGEVMDFARKEWPILVENAVSCALAYEDEWFVGSSRNKVVWLLVGDGGNELPNIVESFIKELRSRDRISRERQFVTGSSGLSSGLHTGVIYQLSDIARNLEGGYPITLLSAFSDQMLLANCDFIVASSGSAVSSTSAFAKGAARRGGKSKQSFCVTKPTLPQCKPVCAQGSTKYPC